MAGIDGWISEILAAGEATAHWARFEDLDRQPGGVSVLVQLHRELRPHAVLSEGWQARTFMDRIECILALRPSPEHGRALVEILEGEPSRRRRAHVLDMAAQGFAWDDLRRQLAGASPCSDAALADLAASHALRGRSVVDDPDLRQAWHRLGDRLDEMAVAWLDPELLLWASGLEATSYSTDGSSGRGMVGPNDSPSGELCADQLCQPLPDPEEGLEFATSITTSSNGLDASVQWLTSKGDGSWPSRCPGFGPLEGTVPEQLRVSSLRPTDAFRFLGQIAVSGGAYDHGMGVLAGLQAVWRDLRRLSGLAIGAPSRDVASAMLSSTWVAYPIDLPWFAQVAWDGFLGCRFPATGHAALVAWTDED